MRFFITCALLSVWSASVPAQSILSPAVGQYRIVSGQSILRVMVGRAGLLSRLGHNHVIVNRSISGMIVLDAQPDRSRARLRIPVDGLIVDEAVERRRAGNGYESMPDEKARTDTRANMLRPEVLDGQRWPEIVIDATIADNDSEPRMFDVTLTFKGTTIPLRLPAVWSVNDDRLSVRANFSLEHAELGLRPFSALGGALKVAATLRFELELTAENVTEMRRQE